ncbi:NUDIX hydrolase [Streptomyces sp. NPDC048611]|uniref:NUDIX hydrolase n=1 Tax=Streptomyces sp. NPDC048611 TaxID=3155635 RepID=UPI00341A3F43
MTATTPGLTDLRPLAALINRTLQTTPARLGCIEGTADLTAALTTAVATYMGHNLQSAPRVLGEIIAEHTRQDATWGADDHPDTDPRDTTHTTHARYAHHANIWWRVNKERANRTTDCCSGYPEEPHTHTAWDGVLLEEVYGALAESDPAQRRACLIQVATKAAAWIEAIDRRTAPQSAPES